MWEIGVGQSTYETVPYKFKYRCMTYSCQTDLHSLLVTIAPNIFFEILLKMLSNIRIKSLKKYFLIIPLNKRTNFTTIFYKHAVQTGTYLTRNNYSHQAFIIYCWMLLLKIRSPEKKKTYSHLMNLNMMFYFLRLIFTTCIYIFMWITSI